MMWYVECDMIKEMKFVWDAMITPILPGGMRRENTVSDSATLLSVMFAVYVTITGYVHTL